jgi:hypothetical protein
MSSQDFFLVISDQIHKTLKDGCLVRILVSHSSLIFFKGEKSVDKPDPNLLLLD